MQRLAPQPAGTWTMRVLWIVRENLTQHPGGDTTQILKTRHGLEALGVAVDLTHRADADWHGYDLIHLFHLDRLWEHLPICKRIRAAGVPAVLSTIYWPPHEFDRGGRAGIQGAMARLLGSNTHQSLRLMQRFAMHGLQNRSLRGWSRRLFSFRNAARYLLESVRVILPNSRAEQDQIEGVFGVCRPAVVVPNAADADTFGLRGASTETERNGVLCVGRIEPRKNQLALLRALRDSKLELTFVGQAGRFSRAYAREFHNLAARRPNTRILPQCAPEELAKLYRAARVHACVSWYETPGLASLEAGLCGCTLVVTPGGCTREYFGDEARYADAQDPASIRAAIEAAYSADTKSALARRIAEQFNWSAAAARTHEAYAMALRGQRCF